MIDEILEKLKQIQPEYTTKLPSSKKEVIYTPFKIKDEKTLSLISEEKNIGMVLKNLCNLIKNCSSEKQPELLCLADFEHLFLQIRSKSVEEQIYLVLEETPPIRFSVNVNDIQFNEGKIKDKIILSNNLTVELTQPIVKDYFELQELNNSYLLPKIITAIILDKHRYDLTLLKTQEISKILEEIHLKYVNIFKEFLDNAPKLTYTVPNNNNPIKIEGFLRFFI